MPEHMTPAQRVAADLRESMWPWSVELAVVAIVMVLSILFWVMAA